MTQVLRNVFLFLLIAASAAAQPTITSISPTTAARSGRLLIQGTGFGAVQGGGHVTVAGIVSPLTRWSDTLIAAYVPESALIGRGNVQVFNSQGAASNPVPITVTSRPPQTGQIRWRFQADGDYIPNRPAVGADGTVYASDVYGHLYAVDPTGGLKWIFNGSGGNVSLGQDGTIYVGSTTSIFALTPNGTLKWQFDQSPSAFIMLGPNVGPDGNIYVVATQGMGVFSLTPQGSLRWSVPENYDRPIVTMQEIVFGPAAQSRLYFHANNHLRGIGLNGAQLFTYADGLDTLQGDPQPAVGPDGSVYTNLQSVNLGKFDNNGNLLWHIFDWSNVVSTPDVGPDGRIYDGQNLINLYAINSNGTVQWHYTDSGILFGPVVSPLNDLLLVGGIVTYGQPGFFEAVSTNGVSLWKEILPVENGLNIWPMSRARFTPDGQTAYVGTSIAGQSGIGYSYLYSVQTGNSAVTLSSLTLNPTTVVGGSTSTGTVTLSGPAPSGGAVVSLISDNPSVASVPATVTVSAGQTTASFTVTTSAVSTATRVTITASYGTGRVSATLTVNPPSLVSLTLVPNTVRGGTPSTGTVVLNGPAPAGGVVVRLSSSNPILVNVPSSVTVAAGSTSASFTARTRFTPTRTVVTVSAWNGTVLKRATLTVTP
jgi:IPT/TIG domain/PQQ-like domain